MLCLRSVDEREGFCEVVENKEERKTTRRIKGPYKEEKEGGHCIVRFTSRFG